MYIVIVAVLVELGAVQVPDVAVNSVVPRAPVPFLIVTVAV
jgi:hypothetical protein